MEIQDRELVRRLIDEDEDFRNKYETHREYDTMISRLEKKPFLSATDTLERSRLKKLKLALKDELERALAEHRRTMQ